MTNNIPGYLSRSKAHNQRPFLYLLGICMLLAATNTFAATYKLTFNGGWDATDVTGINPAGAHFSELVGATHTAGQPLWQPGTLATPGIENVAETGDSTVLKSEINTAISSGTATSLISANGISNDGSSITIFNIFDNHSSVSLASMIAPSPDWFVGVYDLSLKSDGNWITDLTIDLTPWDAGTEEGNLFSLSNPDSNPLIPIAELTGSPFIGTPVIGTLQFELIAVPVPSSLVLFLSGLALLVRRFRRTSSCA